MRDRTRARADGPKSVAGTWVLVLVGLVALALPGGAAAGAPPGANSATAIGLSLLAEPLNGSVPLVVEFRATVTPSDLSATFTWTFADGSNLQQVATGYSAVAHSYLTAGTYLAAVFVESLDGDANATVSIDAGESPIAVQIVATPLSGPAPLTVHFVATLAGGTGTYTAITWQFGDGGNGSGTDLEYTYTKSGDFDARLNVTDSAGATTTAEAGITVSPATSYAFPTGGSPTSLFAAIELGAAIALVVGAILAAVYRAALLRREPPEAPAPAPTPTGAVAPSVPAPGPAKDLGPPAPEALAGTVLPASVRDDSRRLSEHIVVHLYWYGRPVAEGVAREDSTQAGLARRLRVTQSSISKSLQRLLDAGVVSMEMRHVPGAPRRLKTYTLTPRGEAVARSIQGSSERPPRS